MTHARTESTWIARLYAALVEVSATAVAVHYDAPWNPAPGRHAPKR